MNLPEIKALIDAMAASDLSEMELTRDGTLLRLVRRKPTPATAPPEAPPQVVRPAAPRTQRQPSTAPAATTTEPSTISAPLYGVVHWRPSPDAPPFVSLGQAIKAGHVVCVIEAMKVFNEIRTEHDATVLSLLVESGQEVETGQPLLRLG